MAFIESADVVSDVKPFLVVGLILVDVAILFNSISTVAAVLAIGVSVAWPNVVTDVLLVFIDAMSYLVVTGVSLMSVYVTLFVISSTAVEIDISLVSPNVLISLVDAWLVVDVTLVP